MWSWSSNTSCNNPAVAWSLSPRAWRTRSAVYSRWATVVADRLPATPSRVRRADIDDLRVLTPVACDKPWPCACIPRDEGCGIEAFVENIHADRVLWP